MRYTTLSLNIPPSMAVLWNPSHCIPPPPSGYIPPLHLIDIPLSISVPQYPSPRISRWMLHEAHNLSQEKRVPSAPWLPSHPQLWSSARDSWRAGISVRRWAGLIVWFLTETIPIHELSTYSTMGFTADVHKAKLLLHWLTVFCGEKGWSQRNGATNSLCSPCWFVN